MRSLRTRLLFCILACAPFALAAGEAQWCEVKSPSFTVISDAPIRQARQVAKSLEQFRIVLQSTLPTLRMDPGFPLLVFALRDGSSLKALVPGDRQEPGTAQPGGFFLSDPGRDIAAFRIDDRGRRGYHVMYHEYVHRVMNLNFRHLPLWLFEGLAELYSYATVSDGESGVGRTNAEYLEFLKASSMVPLDVLMSVKHDSPYYRRQDMSRVFYAQSWALTHYLILGDRQAHSGQLMEFLRLIRKDVPEKEAVERAFGDLGTLQGNLEKYIRAGKFYYAPVDAKLSVKESRFAARKLPAEESLALRGELLARTGRTDDARALLEQALRRNPRSAAAHEAMALLFLSLRDPEKSLEHFLKAAELNPGSFLAQYYCAELIFLRDKDHEAAGKFLRKTLSINPKFVPAYSMLSRVLRVQASKLPEALDLAMKAAELEPGESRHWVNAGQILAAMGRYDEAKRIGDRLLETARTEEDARQAELLLAVIYSYRDRVLEAGRRAEAMREESRKMAERQSASAELETALGDLFSEMGAPAAGKAPARELAGLVRAVECVGSEVMNVVIEAEGATHRLRAPDRRQIRYRREDSSSMSGFEPCRELEGRRVRIEYLSVTGREYSGVILTVVLQK